MSLDWVPLYIQRLKASRAWKKRYQCPDGLTDYQFGWYMRLLVEAADNNGYLPGNPDELWDLAGAKSRPYFEKWGGLELVNRYFVRADDGTGRMYNPKMLAVVGEQSRKLKGAKQKSPPSSLSLSVSSQSVDLTDDLPASACAKKVMEEIDYCGHTREMAIVTQAIEAAARKFTGNNMRAAELIIAQRQKYMSDTRIQRQFKVGPEKFLKEGLVDETLWRIPEDKGRIQSAIDRAFED